MLRSDARASLHYKKLGFKADEARIPVLMIRGLARSVDHWQGYDRSLAKYHPVITMENRGMGRSNESLPWGWSLQNMAEDVLAVLDELLINKAHLFGVSLGGMVALKFAVLFPSRASSVCAANSSIGPVQNRLTVEGLKAFLRVAVDRKNAEAHLSRVLVSRANSKEKLQQHVAEWNSIREKYGFSTGNAGKQLLAAVRFGPAKQLNKIECSTLVVAGTDDLLVPNSGSELIQKNICSSKLVKIRGAGHELMLDKPVELTATYNDFIHGL